MSDYHPLIAILLQYYNGFDDLKDQYADLGNPEFNQNHGLAVRAPVDWPVNAAVQTLIEHASTTGVNGITCVYPSADRYHEILDELSEKFKAPQSAPSEGPDEAWQGWIDLTKKVTFIHKSEIFEAIHSPQDRSGNLKRIRSLLSDAELTIVLNSSRVSRDVLEHIQGFCDRCLIFIN